MRLQWVIQPDHHPAEERLAQALGVPPLVARLLAGRGYEDPEAAQRFLDGQPTHLSDPALLMDLDKAADRLGALVVGAAEAPSGSP